MAELAARDSQETLRVFSLKIKEDDYHKRIMGTVNAELSPFKDDEARDSVFMREMLDHYRKMDDFKDSTSDRQIERNDTTVHAYLKNMENSTDALSGVNRKDQEDLKVLEKL